MSHGLVLSLCSFYCVQLKSRTIYHSTIELRQDIYICRSKRFGHDGLDGLNWIGWDWNGNKINSGIVYCSIWSIQMVCNDLNIIILMLEGVQMWMLALG